MALGSGVRFRLSRCCPLRPGETDWLLVFPRLLDYGTDPFHGLVQHPNKVSATRHLFLFVRLIRKRVPEGFNFKQFDHL